MSNPHPFDPDEASTNEFDPLVPRAIDLPTTLPATGSIDPEVGDIAKIFAAPADPADWPDWRRALDAWRTEARARLDYSGTLYDQEYAAWTRSCYSVALAWLWDERLFDHEAQRFTVERYLESTSGFGGFDAIVLWHAYPVIGIDDRNQYDFYRGVPGIAELIAEFRDRGIRVFLDYNPWDTGTRRPERDDPAELAAIVSELHSDGLFLDTMKEGGAELIQALLSADPPQVLEGESRVQLARIEDHHLSWAQWFADSVAPGVLRAHWYERKHMLHHTRRWNRDHSDELQSSWMNGTGILVWDAVFGSWVGWNERDQATLRRMLRVQRAANDVFVHGTWTPLTDASPAAIAAGVYASRFEHEGITLWTLVNRGESDFTGSALEVVFPTRAFDVTAGAELAPSGIVTVPAHGVAGILAHSDVEPAWLRRLLADAAADSQSSDPTFPARAAQRVAVAAAPVADAPAGAVLIEPGEREVTIRFRRRETGMYDGAPYVEEWKPLPPRLHDLRTEQRGVRFGSVAVARREVSRNEFLAFVEHSGYVPAVPHRFLVSGDSDAATGVSLADARAFAAWSGGRLPTEFEWQEAAAFPSFERSEPLVWNLTESEHTDGITRFVLLKGGSAYEPAGSDWYFDGGPRPPEFTAKYLLAGLGVERSPNIGFRLAWDLA